MKNFHILIKNHRISAFFCRFALQFFQMKPFLKGLFFIAFVLISINMSGQDNVCQFLGNWSGTLQSKWANTKMVFKFQKLDSNKCVVLFDSPDQSAYDIKVNKVIFHKDSLFLSLSSLNASYKAFYNGISFSGIFKQSGYKFNLTLVKDTTYRTPSLLRHQEPKPPYAYIEEEVTIVNKKDKIQLSGTLTYPKDGQKHIAVILISGSGPQDRNEELLKHKPFLVIADYLTRNGIAVLRYDDRGVGKSTGDFNKATTMDFATDAEAAFKYLQKRKDIINTKFIGLLGHSEGGMIAPIVATRNNKVSFIVLLAAPGVPITQLMQTQFNQIAIDNELDDTLRYLSNEINLKVFNIISKGYDNTSTTDSIKNIYKKYLAPYSESKQKEMGYSKAIIETSSLQFLTVWFKYFIAFKPDIYLRKVYCPVLAINGSLDHQVDAKQNLEAIEQSLNAAKNKNFTIINIKGVNHLFQNAKTGAGKEYIEIEETFSPEVLKIIEKWVNKLPLTNAKHD